MHTERAAFWLFIRIRTTCRMMVEQKGALGAAQNEVGSVDGCWPSRFQPATGTRSHVP